MGTFIKRILIAAVVIVALIFIYRIAFVRTVNYEIGGIKIPSKYNALTGTVTPILNYKGRDIKKTVVDRKAGNIGLSGEEVTLAQFRWALFEQWVKAQPQYRGWESNPVIFKKANDGFRKVTEASGTQVKIVK